MDKLNDMSVTSPVSSSNMSSAPEIRLPVSQPNEQVSVSQESGANVCETCWAKRCVCEFQSPNQSYRLYPVMSNDHTIGSTIFRPRPGITPIVRRLTFLPQSPVSTPVCSCDACYQRPQSDNEEIVEVVDDTLDENGEPIVSANVERAESPQHRSNRVHRCIGSSSVTPPIREDLRSSYSSLYPNRALTLTIFGKVMKLLITDEQLCPFFQNTVGLFYFLRDITGLDRYVLIIHDLMNSDNMARLDELLDQEKWYDLYYSLCRWRDPDMIRTDILNTLHRHSWTGTYHLSEIYDLSKSMTELTKCIGSNSVSSLVEALERHDFEVLFNVVASTITYTYNKAGYTWDGYFRYVNVSHPFYQAMLGKVRLTPGLFELHCPAGNREYGDGLAHQLADIKGKYDYDKILSLSTRDSGNWDLRGVSWTIMDLKKLIISTTLKSAGEDRLLSIYEDSYSSSAAIRVKGVLQNYLTLDRITGRESHQNLPVPGFFSYKRPINRCLYLACPRVSASKDFYMLVARRLLTEEGLIGVEVEQRVRESYQDLKEEVGIVSLLYHERIGWFQNTTADLEMVINVNDDTWPVPTDLYPRGRVAMLELYHRCRPYLDRYSTMCLCYFAINLGHRSQLPADLKLVARSDVEAILNDDY